jgi:hypothetical protein
MDESQGAFDAGVKLTVMEDWQQKFDEFKDALANVAGATEDAGKQVKENVEAIAGNTLSTVIEHAKESLDQVVDFGMGILNRGKDFVMKAVHAAAGMDDTLKQMQIVFKDKAVETFEKTEEAADNAGFAFHEAAGFVTGMGKMGVDALAKVTTKTGESITALESLDDLSAFTGQSLGAMQQTMARAFSMGGKNAKGLERTLGRLFARAPLTAWEKQAISSAHGMQKKFEAVAQIVQNKFGGMSNITDMSFNELSKNIDDVGHDILAKMGKPLQDAMVPLLNDVYKFALEVKRNKPLFEAIGQIFKEIGVQLTFFVQQGLKIARFLVTFITEHRELFKTVVIWGAYGVAILTAAAAALSAAIAVGLFIKGIALAIPAIVGGAAAIGTVVAIIGALVAIGYLFYRMYTENWAGFGDLVDRIKIGIIGLWEVMTSWSNGTAELSEETAASLQKAGIFEWVVNVGGWIGSLIDYVKEALSFILGQWRRVADALQPVIEGFLRVWSRLFQIFVEVGQSFGLVSNQLDGTKSTIDTVVGVVNTLIDTFVWVLGLLADMFSVLEFVIGIWGEFANIIAYVITGNLTPGFMGLSGAGQTVAIIFRSVIDVFITLWRIIEGIGKTIFYVIDALAQLATTWNPAKMKEIVQGAWQNIASIKWTADAGNVQGFSYTPGNSAADGALTADTYRTIAIDGKDGAPGAVVGDKGSSVVDELKNLRRDMAGNKPNEKMLAGAMAEALEDARARRHKEEGGGGAVP